MSEPSILKITELIQDIQKEYLKINKNPDSNDISMIIIDEKINEICIIIRNEINDTDDIIINENNDTFIKNYIKKIFNNEDSFKFVDIDNYTADIKLSPDEKKFLFFINYNLISRNVIPRIKPLFKLSDALEVLKINFDLDDPKIIALYAYDNIFSIKLLEKINSLIFGKACYFSNINDITNYQQLKYIYGILNSSEQFNEYKNKHKKGGGGQGEQREQGEQGEQGEQVKSEQRKRERDEDEPNEDEPNDKYVKIDSNMNSIYDFIFYIINSKSSDKDDLYDLDCGIYFTNETYKNEYKISLEQFNMLISNDSEYIKNMFDILFKELKNDVDIKKTISINIKNINDFAIFLFSKDFFIRKLNYMHGKLPSEKYSIIDDSTILKILNGLTILKDTNCVDNTETFENFKNILLAYLDGTTTYDSNIFTQGDIKHTIDTLIKIYYNAYLLGKQSKQSKQCSKPQNGGKYYNYKNTGIKKIFNKKERCIYKMQGSNKEYIRHKNELISFKDFKTINNKPVKTDNKPVKTDKKSVNTEKNSVKTDKKPVKTDKKPVKTDKKSLKTDKKSVKTEKKTVKTDKKPVKTEKKSVKTDKKPVKTDKKPVKTDKKPVKKNIFFNLF